MEKKHVLLQRFSLTGCIWGILFWIGMGLLFCPVSAADANIQAELGDTLNLHGISYTSSQVYLFMTGPGLDPDGVPLTNVFAKAKQGNFTIINVDSSQQWSYRWDTSKIEKDIKPGTYLVYVTTEPVDKSNLGGTSTYKTLEVYLKDADKNSQISISTGTSYTLNPEMHSSVYTPPLNLTTPLPTTLLTTQPPTLSPTQSPPPLTTKASLQVFPAFLAGILCLLVIRRLNKTQ